MTITRVQGNARGLWTSGSSVTVNLSAAPSSGNTLIATISTRTYNSQCIASSISQQNVSWSRQNNHYYSHPGGQSWGSEIWLGVVSASAGTTATINLQSAPQGDYPDAVVNICEYSGILNTGALDQTGYDDAETVTASTGSTNPTTQASELWIGSIASMTYGQYSPTNGFTLLDGACHNWAANAYLEKVVSSTGTAYSGTTLNSTNFWVGCIATFKATSGGQTTYVISASCSDSNASITPSGSVVVNAGANQSFSISANSGYHIAHVWVNSVDQGALSAYTFYNVNANQMIYVNAEPNTVTYTITASADSHSSISPSGNVVINSGANQPFSMSANSGYHITHVYVNSADQGALSSYTFNNVTANQTISVASAQDSSGDLTVTGNLTVNQNASVAGALTANSLTVHSVMTSDVSGSYPQAYSNAGMILDFYPNLHSEGIGIQSGGPWIKYGTSFNIFHDNGTNPLLSAVSIDENRKVTIGGALTVGSVMTSNASGSYPQPYSNAGMILDFYPATHSEGLGIQPGGPWIKYGTNFTIYHDNGTNVQSAISIDENKKITIGSSLILSSAIQHLSPTAIIDAIWHFNGTDWQPLGLPIPTSKLTMTSSDGYSLNLFEIISDGGGSWVDPLLATDVGLVVKKDIAAGGFLSTNQGEVWIGHGRKDIVDPPKIILTHADGYVYNGAYNTLYLRKRITDWRNADYNSNDPIANPGNLDLGNLIAHGTINVYNNTGFRTFSVQQDGKVYIGSLNFSGTRLIYADSEGLLGTNYSSERFKEDIRNLNDCSWLYKLRPVTFNWKEKTRGPNDSIGLIAEEVYSINPQFAWLDGEGKPEGVHYEWLGIPLLVELKKLRMRIEEIENQLKRS